MFPTLAAKHYGNFDAKRQCVIDMALDERQIGMYSKFSEKVRAYGFGAVLICFAGSPLLPLNARG